MKNKNINLMYMVHKKDRRPSLESPLSFFCVSSAITPCPLPGPTPPPKLPSSETKEQRHYIRTKAKKNWGSAPSTICLSVCVYCVEVCLSGREDRVGEENKNSRYAVPRKP